MIPLQETFDTVVTHLRKQGKKAIVKNKKGGGDECCYRTPDGLKCAAGCLLSDEDYKPHYEGKTVHHFTQDGSFDPAICPPSLLQHDYNLLQRLQSIHDCHDEDDWESSFRQTAFDFKLTYTPPGETK